MAFNADLHVTRIRCEDHLERKAAQLCAGAGSGRRIACLERWQEAITFIMHRFGHARENRTHLAGTSMEVGPPLSQSLLSMGRFAVSTQTALPE